MATAKLGTYWRTSKLEPSNEFLRGVASASTQWVFVGYQNVLPKIYTIGSSAFDTTPGVFTSRTPNGSDPLHAVDWIASEDLVFACGNNGRLEYSSDKGATWASFTVTDNPNLYGIVGVSGDANSNFIAVGVDAIWGRFSNGTWSRRWSLSQVFRDVAYLAGAGFVAVGDGGVVGQSPTGLIATWNGPYPLASTTLNTVAANNEIFMTGDSDGNVYRSETGLSGGWVQKSLVPGTAINAITSVPGTTRWAAISADGDIFTTEDNGVNWTQADYQIADQVRYAFAGALRAGAVGDNGAIYTSNESVQADHVPVEPEPVESAFAANDDMAGDAVRRLLSQFRS